MRPITLAVALVVVGFLLSHAARAQSNNCADAPLIASGTYAGSTAGATPDGSSSCGQSNTTPDVWYRYAATQAGVLRANTCGSGYDTVLSVHSGCPGTPTNQLACNDDTGGACGLGSTVQVVTAPLTEYFIRVTGWNGASGPFTLSLSFEVPQPGPDSCFSPQTITDGIYMGTTLGATNDGTASCGLSNASPDLWYRYVPASSCPVNVDTCGSSYDTVLSVHTACPPNNADVACNDDSCALSSTLTFAGTAGQAYLIRVSGYNGASGDFTLRVALACPLPGPDNCADAIDIPDGVYDFTTIEATPDGSSSCGLSNSTPDVWFRYTAASDDTVVASLCGSAFDTVLSVHAACPGSAANEIACNDDSCVLHSSVTLSPKAGAVYLIRVSGYSGAVGSFRLQVRSFVGGEGADVYVGELGAMVQLGRVGDTVGCAIDTPLCNAGTVPLVTRAFPNPNHPFFVFNMYRLKGDRFEQIGQSWAKHMQGSAQGNACGFGCQPFPNGQGLGVGCSDTYSASYNGTQSIMGPRSEINPWNGFFDPATSHLNSPNNPPHTPVSHRLQLRDPDLVPALNPGAVYFAEQYTLANDDRDHMNSLAREPVVPTGAAGGTWTFNLAAQASINGPAIDSWPGSTRSIVQSSPASDGRCILRAKATPNGDGSWHYEYALYNHDMDRAVRSFSVPVGANTVITNIGFSAPLSHDEPFHNNPWPATRTGATLTWQTDASSPANNSNPVRWGTLYNFRFDAGAAPVPSTATLGMYKPGTPDTLSGNAPAPAAACPADFNGDNTVNSQDFFDFLAAFFAGQPTADFNRDGTVNSQDFFDFLAAFFAGCP